ncbi:hypothetical protein [Desulfogranum japonicum]|uniref:hypothetical protein n=1 Tax=Desulfogranum japonicum TaxID=231447 RepID=UPI000558CAD1|nr:hypothetical protein [Desulfogranum japonicum]
MYLRIFFCMALFLLCAFSQNSYAHRVRVFAFTSGQEIVVEGNFGKDRPAKNTEVVIIQPSDQQVLCKGQTDSKGEYRCPIPEELQHVALEVILKAGQGHQAKWLLEPQTKVTASPTPPAASVAQPAEQTDSVQMHDDDNHEILIRAVEEVVSREIEPLKRMIMEEKDKGPGIQEIIGGIGWIIGIVSLLFIIQSKKRKKGE